MEEYIYLPKIYQKIYRYRAVSCGAYCSGDTHAGIRADREAGLSRAGLVLAEACRHP